MKRLFELSVSTRGCDHIVDITDDLRNIVSRCSREEGAVLVFVPGATGAVTTIEYEPGLQKDFPELMESLIPAAASYHHNDTWQDGNGHSHLRASLIGPSVTVPFSQGDLMLGTWQQVVFLEFDNRPRNRRLIIKILD